MYEYRLWAIIENEVWNIQFSIIDECLVECFLCDGHCLGFALNEHKRL